MVSNIGRVLVDGALETTLGRLLEAELAPQVVKFSYVHPASEIMDGSMVAGIACENPICGAFEVDVPFEDKEI